MKREIKFRGLRTDGKVWVAGSLVNNLWIKSKDKKQVTEIITTDLDGYDGDCWEDVINECVIEVIPESVGQYTGLKDKNGKEIFEGDILLFENSIKNIVIFHQGSFGYDSFREIKTDYMNFVELSNYHFKYDALWRGMEIEVIGNIHD